MLPGLLRSISMNAISAQRVSLASMPLQDNDKLRLVMKMKGINTHQMKKEKESVR